MASPARPGLKTITSGENPRYKELRRLAQSAQARGKSGLSVLDGVHLVAAYHKHHGVPQQLVVSKSGVEDPEIRALVQSIGGADALLMADPLFRHLSPVETPTGILAVVRTPRPQPPPREMGACVMLEDIQDPGNLGSILRTCAAAGIRHVLLSSGSVHAWSPRALRAGMGAHFALAVHEQADLPAAARAFRGTRVATRQGVPESVFNTDLRGDVAFFFGNEGAGLSRELLGVADVVVSVPMPGPAESLNVAAAAAVCLFERVRQLRARGMGNRK
jgi:RNA methyltransferase, TrmH family